MFGRASFRLENCHIARAMLLYFQIAHSNIKIIFITYLKIIFYAQERVLTYKPQYFSPHCLPSLSRQKNGKQQESCKRLILTAYCPICAPARQELKNCFQSSLPYFLPFRSGFSSLRA